MSITPGTRIGPYHVQSPLGAGGMGVVFRAHDTKLKRDVALKLLPDHFADDPDRLSRFQREAQLLASLNHPNIAQIYGLEESNGTCCIVMELVEGETLQERLKRGPIPTEEALPIATQVADALEAAHERGIMHRDLKPANVKISPDGKVKVLDFGLAKAIQHSPMSPALSNSPTMMTAAQGMILGTAAYMSPEQAKGKELDRTADVWAFGCVLYEMLTGRPVFDGETVGEILGGVFKAEPEWRQLPDDTPQGILRLLRRCLQKDRKQRLQSIGDARIEIQEAQEDIRSGPHPVQRARMRRERLAWISILMLVTLIAVVAIVMNSRAVPPPREVRLDINAPPTSDPMSFAISPDGQKIVFAGTFGGQSSLWLRSLDSASARPLAGTDNASLPFWSPDSQSVGFFADGKLKKTDVFGGAAQILAGTPIARGGAWGPDNTILFVPSNSALVLRISANGGEASPATQLGTQQASHSYPQFLPDGTHFLYYTQGAPEARGIYVGRLGSTESRRLFDAESNALYVFGHLLFSRQGVLFARSFDPVRFETKGNPFPVAEQIAINQQGGMALSVSAAGPISYRTGSAAGLRQFVWVDRSGRELSKVGDPIGAALNPSLSPDGRRVALQRTLNGNTDIWLLETDRGLLTRFTSDASVDVTPRWFPDGNQIAFGSARRGAVDLYRKSATGLGPEELLVASPQTKTVMDFSPDGQLMLYRSADPKLGFDIWALRSQGDSKPFPVVRTEFEERDAQFSPDGKWIAYQSNESGRYEIYVQPFPGPGAKWLISTNGGGQPRWRRDGKELFYVAMDGRLMSVAIELSRDGKTAKAGIPLPLFNARIGSPVPAIDSQQYVVAADGQRFLMNTLVEEASNSAITIILNWKPKP